MFTIREILRTIRNITGLLTIIAFIVAMILISQIGG